MPQKSEASVLVASVILAACAGVSPLPMAAASADIPAVELGPGELARRDAAIDEAVIAVVRRRYDDARAAAERALAVDPRAARARSVLGMVLLQEARLVEPPDLHLQNRGEAEVLTAEQLEPADAFCGWMRAVFLAESGHMSAAAAAAEAALSRTREAPAAERAALLGIAGTYRYELGEDRAALPHLQEYVALRPDDATAQFRLGSSLLRVAEIVIGPEGAAQSQVRAENAARAFARCHELAPGDEDAGLSIGKAWLRAAELAADRGQQDRADAHRAAAAKVFATVAERFPQSAEPWFCTAVAAERRDDLATANRAYEEALARDARHLPSLLNLAVLQDADLRGAGAEAESRERLCATLQRVLDADTDGQLSRSERARVARRLAELTPP